jgi:hypothetical protein
LGFRFQSRLKLFPGVRLNFSRGGISTTIGVRGAGVTLGKKGAYVNLGIPGTGLSYRERIALPSERVQARRPQPAQEPLSERPQVSPQPPQDYSNFETRASVPGAIHSGPVSTMTSAGLDELKKLINEAAVKHIELTMTVAANEDSLRRAQSRLRRVQWFIVRLFTKQAIPKLVVEVTGAEDALAQALSDVRARGTERAD